MDAIFTKLISESPYIAALLIMTFINQKSIERITTDFSNTIKERDQIFLDMMQKLSAQLSAIDIRHAAHAEEMTQSLDSMRRVIGTKTKGRRQKGN